MNWIGITSLAIIAIFVFVLVGWCCLTVILSPQ